MFFAIELNNMRSNAGIDPVMSIWNWEIPVYLFLGGLVAGLMVVGALIEYWWPERWEARLSRVGALFGIGLLSLGMLALFLDLANKINVYRFYLAFKVSSPMSWGAWILLLAYPALGLWLLGGLEPATVEQLNERFPRFGLLWRLAKTSREKRRPILLATAAVGVGLGVYTGILLQTLVARPLWNSALLGPLFLASGVSAGAALYLISTKEKKSTSLLLRWDIWALSIELGLLALFVIDRMNGGLEVQKSLALLLAGPFTGAFFGLVVLLGILVPLAVESGELLGKAHSRYLVPALVLLGGLALRVIMVSAGQSSVFGAM